LCRFEVSYGARINRGEGRTISEGRDYKRKVNLSELVPNSGGKKKRRPEKARQAKTEGEGKKLWGKNRQQDDY